MIQEELSVSMSRLQWWESLALPLDCDYKFASAHLCYGGSCSSVAGTVRIKRLVNKELRLMSTSISTVAGIAKSGDAPGISKGGTNGWLEYDKMRRFGRGW